MSRRTSPGIRVVLACLVVGALLSGCGGAQISSPAAPGSATTGMTQTASSPLRAANAPLPGPPAWVAHPPIHARPNATTSPTGLSPSQIRYAYGFDPTIAGTGAGRVIAVVDAYDDPTAESDLGVFSSQYGLPPATSANGLFQKIYASGKPRTNSGWALEVSLDVQWAHAIAPGAKILLVEARSANLADLLTAVDVAVQQGASVVSMSWGGGEFSSEASYDAHFNRSGVSFFASSGDSGAGVEWPAVSAFVTAVGGTTLNLDGSGNVVSETGWSGSGGGVSAYVRQPSYQNGFQSSGSRTVPDVSYDADPNSGVAVYDSTPFQGQSGWFQVGGTSAGAPQWAALTALRDGIRGNALTQANPPLYGLAATSYGTYFRDILTGSNGTFSCATGYDLVTGLGSPRANALLGSGGL